MRIRTQGVALAAALLLAGAAMGAAPTEEWTLTHDGGGAYTDEGTSAVTDPAGNLVVGGESHDGIDGSDMLIMKLDRDDHSVIWERRVPAYDGNDMALSRIIWDGFGDLLVGGYIRGCVG